jgi:hypothetical protein
MCRLMFIIGWWAKASAESGRRLRPARHQRILHTIEGALRWEGKTAKQPTGAFAPIMATDSLCTVNGASISEMADGSLRAMYEGLGYRQNSRQKRLHHKRCQRPQHHKRRPWYYEAQSKAGALWRLCEGHGATKPNRRSTLYDRRLCEGRGATERR